MNCSWVGVRGVRGDGGGGGGGGGWAVWWGRGVRICTTASGNSRRIFLRDLISKFKALILKEVESFHETELPLVFVSFSSFTKQSMVLLWAKHQKWATIIQCFKMLCVGQWKCFTESRELLLLVGLEQHNWFGPFWRSFPVTSTLDSKSGRIPPLACFVTWIWWNNSSHSLMVRHRPTSWQPAWNAVGGRRGSRIRVRHTCMAVKRPEPLGHRSGFSFLKYYSQCFYFFCVLTARKRSLRRLCFYTCLSVILFTGGRGGIPACLVGLQVHTQRGVEGSGWGVSRSTPGGKLRNLTRGSLQAQTQGGGWGVWPLGRGLQAKTQGEVEGSGQGVYPSMHWGRPPSPADGLLLRAVHILLECIFVGYYRPQWSWAKVMFL